MPVNLLYALVAALVRALVVVVLYVGFVEVLDRSDSDDALGAGLLFFMLVLALAGCWAIRDGWRRGLPTAAAVWTLAGALTGVGIPVASVAMDLTSASIGAEIRGGGLFLALLVAVPALLGAVLGGIAHRSRGGGTATAVSPR